MFILLILLRCFFCIGVLCVWLFVVVVSFVVLLVLVVVCLFCFLVCFVLFSCLLVVWFWFLGFVFGFVVACLP